MPVKLMRTSEVAALFGVTPAAIYSSVSKTGGYHGLKPLRLPSRRVMWVEAEVMRLLKEIGLREECER
jgi:predicted DNA-binding transcriptional regulator AlpA